MAMEITKMNIKLASIYRPLNNKFLNPFMEHIRKKYVCNKQIKKGINGVREVIDYLKKDCSIALMIDQRVTDIATNIDIDILNFKKLLKIIKLLKIDLVIVGPEEPLVRVLLII